MITCLYRVSSAYGSPTLIFAESEDEALSIAIENRWVINKTKAKLEKLRYYKCTTCLSPRTKRSSIIMPYLVRIVVGKLT